MINQKSNIDNKNKEISNNFIINIGKKKKKIAKFFGYMGKRYILLFLIIEI